jgi:hypothetical protein
LLSPSDTGPLIARISVWESELPCELFSYPIDLP